MEGSESEAVFDSYNLNPQLFINEVLNIVDDLVDDAFDFCHQQASALVGGDAGTDRSEELLRGISSLRHIAQTTMNKRLGVWERYCLVHCFSVPDGFSSEKANSSGDGLLLQDGLDDADLDAQLASLREKLAVVGHESAALQGEVSAMEKQSVLHNGYHASVCEVLRLLEGSSVHNLFQEIEESASELYRELGILHKEGIPRGTLKSAGGQNGGRWLNAQELKNAADLLKPLLKP
uniref:Zinc finger MYND domain-containing protein 10 n=1 Tax=Anthurium amnicola TaxID=1678845 RepID=A0A1D1YST3_9ARAE